MEIDLTKAELKLLKNYARTSKKREIAEALLLGAKEGEIKLKED